MRITESCLNADRGGVDTAGMGTSHKSQVSRYGEGTREALIAAGQPVSMEATHSPCRPRSSSRLPRLSKGRAGLQESEDSRMYQGLSEFQTCKYTSWICKY